MSRLSALSTDEGRKVTITHGKQALASGAPRGPLWFAGGSILGAVAGLAVGIVTARPDYALAAFAAAVVLTFIAYMAGVRSVLAAALLFLIAPGVLGETSFVNSAVGAVGLLAVVLTYKPTRSSRLGSTTLVAAFLLFPAFGMIGAYGAPVAAIFGIAAIVASLALSRPQFALDALTGITWTLGLFCASFMVTWSLGQFNGLGLQLPTGTRTLQVDLPFTVSAAGAPFLPGTRRMSPMTGEPGLLALFIAPLLAVVFAKGASRSRRTWTAVILLAAAVFSQSVATIFAVAVALAVGVIAVLWKRRAYVRTVLIVGIGMALAPSAITAALGEKASVAAASFTDRGLANLGEGSAAMYGNINLLVMSSNDLVLFLVMLAGLLCGFAIARRTLGGFVAFLAFAVVAAVAQPVQWHPGGWLLIACAAIFAVHARATAHQPRSLTASSRIR
jgi:hypothetical protein